MSSPTEFRCDEKLVAIVEKAKLPLHGLRTFYALQYLIDSDPTKQFRMMGSPMHKSFEVKARKIIQAMFPAGTNDLRLVQSVGESLIDAGILQQYDYDYGNHSVTFRYSDRAMSAAGPLRNGTFSIMDSTMFCKLSSPAQIYLYVRITMHQGAQAPQFCLPIQSGQGTWLKLRKPWLTAAAKLSTMLGQQYLLCPEIDRMSEKVVRVRVKISHDRTTWYPRSLYCRRADKPPIAVGGGRAAAVTRKELLRREAWTKVGPVPE